jgi:hypothetical protein
MSTQGKASWWEGRIKTLPGTPFVFLLGDPTPSRLNFAWENFSRRSHWEYSLRFKCFGDETI